MSGGNTVSRSTRGITLTADQLNALATEASLLDGLTATAAELNALDITAAGTAQASKAVVLDSSKGISTITSATITTATIPNFAGAETHAGAITAQSTLAVTGAITPTGGVAAAGGFTARPVGIHTGGVPAVASTDGNDSTPVITETYWSEVFVPANMTITGVKVFNGSNVTGNMRVSLATSAGAPIAAALTASTAGSGTDAYQTIPFAVAYAAVGPATYYIGVQYSSATARYNTHTIGTHGVVVKTGDVYGTFTSFTPPAAGTFVTAVGNIASLY